VRAICEAPLAVFDLTGFDAGVLLLLGIRSAVRRGITVTVKEGKVADAGLPFNIVSLNPIPMNYPDLARAFEEGAAAMTAQPEEYLDLPAFDAVRRLGEDHRPIEPQKQVLLLRWFDKKYLKLSDELVRAPFDQEYSKTTLTTLDSRSPQLAPQRLYAAIRRTRLCVADWTGWRPNVFFEIGVRLAVSPSEPIHLICAAQPDGFKKKWPAATGSSEALLRFFKPAMFQVPDEQPVEERLEQFKRDGFVRAPGAALSPGRTHHIVGECLRWEDEPGGSEVEHALTREASAIGGPATPEEGRAVPGLFGGGMALSARKSALDRLFAAWFYLHGRLEIEKHLPDAEPRIRRWIVELDRIWKEILGRSLNIPDSGANAVVEHIAAVMEKTEAARVGASDPLEEARRLKAEAIAARRSGDLQKSGELFNEAVELLSETHAATRSRRGPDLAPGTFEISVFKQLTHLRGSIGGLLRARVMHVESVAAYQTGYELEQEGEREYGMRSSYNLTQRLISAGFADPVALIDPSRRVKDIWLRNELGPARVIIERQIAAGRLGDEYALADLAWMALLSDARDWRERLFDFLDAADESAEPYALRSNVELLKSLIQRTLENPELEPVTRRLKEALEWLPESAA
jgi:hypothetical protein